LAEVCAHDQFVANGMAVAVEDPELGPTTQVGVPAVLRTTPGAVRGPQPPAGAHSREILSEAGCSTAEIAHLLDAGIVEEVSWGR
jgi:crotonobetainyl-CoA:carnitine CoA-transferase CaiB-like acyl-CoA transferase